MKTERKPRTVRYSRMDVLNRLFEEALVPVFYHPDVETVRRVVSALDAAGASMLEFVNRGDQAIEVFKETVKFCRKNLPGFVVGAGSIVDEATAALYVAQGAEFIVGPSFNERVARFCNRRKVPYIPGCQTATEIGNAEEMGVEIVKLFPGAVSGGPEFIKQILGPSPWTKILPTSLGKVTAESVAAWFDSGVCAVGMWPELIPHEHVESGDFDAITRCTAEIREWVRAARG